MPIVKLNMNDYVKVRLTDRGRELMQKDHEEFLASIPLRAQQAIGPFKPPVADDDGYSRFQIWHLMQLFGPHISLGCVMPFDPEIVAA